MNNEEVIAKCLEEAAYLLDEGAVKTSKKYKLDNYLKKYDYQGDRKQGTITVNGEKYKVDRNVNSPVVRDGNEKYARSTSADITGNEKKIVLDKNFEKLKNNKRRDAMLQHEIGHLKYHHITSNDITPEGRKAVIDHLSTTAAENNPRIYKNDAKRIYNERFKDTSKKELSEKDKIHDENLKKYEKYEDSKNSHAHRTEYEADAYASQQKNGDQLFKALREAYKHAKSKKGIDYQLKGITKSEDGLDKKQKEKILSNETRADAKKSQNKFADNDLKWRKKAAKDKTVNKQIYRESIEYMLNETVELTK